MFLFVIVSYCSGILIKTICILLSIYMNTRYILPGKPGKSICLVLMYRTYRSTLVVSVLTVSELFQEVL
jgi:hypothetical protein